MAKKTKTYATKDTSGRFKNPVTNKAAPGAVIKPSAPKAAAPPAVANPFAQVYQDTKSGQQQSTKSTPTFSAGMNNDTNQFIPNASPLTPANQRVSPNTGASKDQVSIQPVPLLPEQTDRMQISQAPISYLNEGSAAIQQPTIGGRLQNVGSVLNAAFNPLSSSTIESSIQNPTGKALVEAGANNPLSTAAIGIGLYGLIKSIAGAVAASTAKTAVQNSLKVGVDLFGNEITGSTASSVAVNSATTAKTSIWLTKAAATLKNPEAVVGTLMAAIGSYPFAGFIKEEALQTLGFATKTAIDNGDLEGAKISLELQREMLNPDFWSKVKSGIPFVNVIDNLDKFNEAAAAKLAVDAKLVDDMQHKQESGEAEDQKWTRVNQEKVQQEKENIDYYNSERKKLLTWENESRRLADIAQNELDKKQRNEDAEFWRREREKQSEMEAKDREATAKFWAAYRKQVQKAQEDARPSKLNFGII